MNIQQIMTSDLTIFSTDMDAIVPVEGIAKYKHAGDSDSNQDSYIVEVEVMVEEWKNPSQKGIIKVSLNHFNEHGVEEIRINRLINDISEKGTVNLKYWTKSS